MFSKTTNKNSTQYVLGAILILTAVLATSAFNPYPVGFDHTIPGGIGPLESVTVQDFQVKEANDRLVTAANWNAVEAFHIKEASDLKSTLSAAAANWDAAKVFHTKEANDSTAAARWDAAKAFHTKEANDAASSTQDAPFPNNSNRH